MVEQNTTVPDSIGREPGAAPASLAIRWVFPSRDGSITRIAPGTLLLGRDSSCGGCLPSASVSRRHAEIEWTVGTAPMLRDLDSTNGVHLNGRSVTRAPLKLHDVIRLGDWIGIITALAHGVPERWSFEELIKGYWAGPLLNAALAPARLGARSDLPIILQGRTGAGKEGAARAIHAWSGREGPFLALNCAALPETLAESELFGYQKGAFTDAVRANPGHLRAADGGTLFLDEIADLPLTIQAKLLRAIEQREVIPLGQSRPVSIDVRLVAATQVSLRVAAAEGRFRPDLLARLEGLTVVIPTLRERAEEIPFLFWNLVEQSRGPAAAPRLDPLLVERLCTYEWPFNVREMAQIVRGILALHPDAPVLDCGMLAELNRAENGLAANPIPEDPPDSGPGALDEQPLDGDKVLAALKANGGNVKRAAEELRVGRTRLYRFIKKTAAFDLTALRQGESD
jgi:transcriptional regulator with PAS, ATPase and Fis domain